MNEELLPFNQNAAIDNDQIRFALTAAGIATWTIDPVNKQIFWDELGRQLLGFVNAERVEYNQVLTHVHPDDIGQVQEIMSGGGDTPRNSHYDFSFRTRHPLTNAVCWITCKGRGYVDASGQMYKFAGTLQDVTRERQVVKARTEAEASLETAFDNASLGLVITDESGRLLVCNQAYSRMLGYSLDELTDESYVAITHPDDQPRNKVLIGQLVRGDISHFNTTKRYVRRDHTVFWVRMNVTRLTDKQGQTSHLLGIAQDVTQDLEERRETSRLGQLVRNAPELMMYMDLGGRVQFMNQYGLDLLGVTSEEIVGKTIHYFSPPEEYGRLEEVILPQMMAGPWSGELMKWNRLSGERIPITTQVFPIDDPVTSEPMAFVAISRDLRLEKRVQQLVEAKNRELELALEIGQLGTYRINLQTNTIIASERARVWWGLSSDVPLLGELLTKVLPTDQAIWNRVISQARQKETGGHHDLTYRVVNRESGEDRYLRSLGQAVYDDDDAAVTLSGTVQDITPQVLMQLKIEESEIRLLSAVNLADLGTWQIDLVAGILSFSDRVRDWYGFDVEETVPIERSYQPVDPLDRPLLEAALSEAIQSGANGEYDVEYRIKSLRTGRRRIIHAKGKTYYDLFLEAYRVSGTMQDVTEQRQTELALDMEVQERTEELAATNEEMAAMNEELTATNEELAVTNEELTETNQDLIRSNENLEQFAYIASHDLQEPLRKIQQFGDLLKTRHFDESTEEFRYLERMQLAASRMSILIKDLLAFSRISTRQASATTVSLAQVVRDAKDSLSVAINESKAQIDVDELPTIQGDPMQLEQLFQNLLSNAIKFSRVNQQGQPAKPHIQIIARLITLDELPLEIKPSRHTKAYYRIDVVDNGVGFEEKYMDRIFQVFQRLHGKNEFAGTGVGLAICQKVVTNHGGIITAASQLGQGATFSVYLPNLM